MNAGANPTTLNNGPDFVRLSIGKTRILLHDDEILSIEPGTNVKQTKKNAGRYITINSKVIPVYDFDEDLRPFSTTNNKSQICICQDNDKNKIGISCDDAAKITLAEMELHELPDCMLDANLAIQVIAVSNNNIYCISNITKLLQLVKQPGEN